MQITIKVEHLFFVIVLIAAIAFGAYQNGYIGKGGGQPVNKGEISKLTQEDCDSVRYVIEVTLQGVEDGNPDSVTSALMNIRSMLPDDIQEVVMKSIGVPPDFDSIREYLTIWENSLPF